MAFRLGAVPAAACRPRSSSPTGRQQFDSEGDRRSSSESSCATADWTRMRTPSPERSYLHGCSLLAPQMILAPVFVPYFYMPEPMMNQQPPPLYPYDEICAPESIATEGNMLDTLSKDFTHRNLKVKMDDTLSQADTADGGDSEDSSLGSEHSSIDDLDDLDLPDGVPSFGSLNHPHSCGQPCKYYKKVRGCKDGLNCVHCHICVWQSRYHGKNKRKNPKSIPAVGELTMCKV